jgi:hypothetical protein
MLILVWLSLFQNLQKPHFLATYTPLLWLMSSLDIFRKAKLLPTTASRILDRHILDVLVFPVHKVPCHFTR